MSPVTAPKIRREVTRNGDTVQYVYSFCNSCSYWHGFAWSLEEAYGQGERHLINVHDIDPRTASTARRVANHRTTTGAAMTTNQPNRSE
jgi:hypothetical protein